jgi:HK97 family phage portal protein
VIREALQGLGLVAYGDPAPGPGVYGDMSRAPGRYLGKIDMVGSMGRPRTATYRQVYLFNPFVYAATNLIARGVGRMPVHVYGFVDGAGNKQRFRSDVPQTPGRPSAGVQLDRLLNQPGRRLSRMAMFTGTIRERIIYGNGLWEIVDQGGGLPIGLNRISWRNVDEVNEDGYGGVNYYKISPAGQLGRQRTLMPEQVVHFGLGSEADQACGISLLESCKHTLALHDAVMRHLLAYFENSARGSGHFKVDTQKQAEDARKMITELYTSPENAGKVLVTNAEWKGMADSPNHSEIVALIQESRTEVAAAFQVPPPVLGLLEHAIRANVKEMREQFVRDTTGPWATDMEGDVAAQLVNPYPLWSSLFAEFEMSEQLRPDLEARALVYQRLIFVFTIDEIRTMENKPPLNIQGVTDVPWAPSGSLPLTTAAGGKNGRIPPPQDPGDSGDPVALSLADARRLVAMLDEYERTHALNGHHELETVT